MLQITCPYCGPRDQDEFTFGGEAHIVRPLDPDSLSEREWGDYLFMRENPKGNHKEQWCHSAACGKWFNVVRDTVTYEIKAIYKVGEQAPEEETCKSHQPEPEND